ncbi:MAG: threonylcarbamoyl-AMP synthase [Myxococcales bacterium]|nr:threonylcarbamoyl-AMP synthase [Myxococcales bacterium]
MTTPVRPAGPDTIAHAAAILRGGGLVALPTETVYGLAANGLDPRAVAGIFAAKGRPADNPLILHVPDYAAVAGIVDAPPAIAGRLAEIFWPGPLTLVLRRSAKVPEIVSAGLETVAVRVPDHPVARAILRACGRPLAAPSANRSGRPSPTRAEHVLADLDGRIDLIVDGGPTAHGIESTVVDLSELDRGGPPLLLRQGAIAREALSAHLPGLVDGAAIAPERSPGLRHRHYAPRARLEIVDNGALAERARALAGEGRTVGVLAGGVDDEAPRDPEIAGVRWLAFDGGLEGYARGLFAGLRTLDALAVERILAAAPPEIGIGRALADRLRRAAAG